MGRCESAVPFRPAAMPPLAAQTQLAAFVIYQKGELALPHFHIRVRHTHWMASGLRHGNLR